MDDSEYKARGAIKTEISKVVKVTYDSKREVIQYQQVINDALDTMLAVRQLQKTDIVTEQSNNDCQPCMERIKEDHADVAAIIGLLCLFVASKLVVLAYTGKSHVTDRSIDRSILTCFWIYITYWMDCCKVLVLVKVKLTVV